MKQEEAEKIAASGFQRLANDDELLMRFCNITGILANEMRKAAQDPNFLLGILEFYLAFEPDLLAWAEDESINPDLIVMAQRVLAPKNGTLLE